MCPGSPAGGQNRLEAGDGSGDSSVTGVRHSCGAEPPVSLMGVSSCWGFAGRIREGEPEHGPFPGRTSHLQTPHTGGGRLALHSSRVPAQLYRPEHYFRFSWINQFFWDCEGCTCDWPLGLSKSEDSVLFVFLCSYQCDISEKCREGGEGWRNGAHTAERREI